jgi:hypothetical protein
MGRRSRWRCLGLALEPPSQQVAIEIDRDNHVRPGRTADRDRDRIGEAAVQKPFAVNPDRAEDPGQSDRRAHRLIDRSGLKPDLPAGDEISGDGCVELRIALDWFSDPEPAEKFDHLFAVDQPAASAHCRNTVSRPAT